MKEFHFSETVKDIVSTVASFATDVACGVVFGIAGGTVAKLFTGLTAKAYFAATVVGGVCGGTTLSMLTYNGVHDEVFPFIEDCINIGIRKFHQLRAERAEREAQPVETKPFVAHSATVDRFAPNGGSVPTVTVNMKPSSGDVTTADILRAVGAEVPSGLNRAQRRAMKKHGR